MADSDIQKLDLHKLDDRALVAGATALVFAAAIPLITCLGRL